MTTSLKIQNMSQFSFNQLDYLEPLSNIDTARFPVSTPRFANNTYCIDIFSNLPPDANLNEQVISESVLSYHSSHQPHSSSNNTHKHDRQTTSCGTKTSKFLRSIFKKS